MPTPPTVTFLGAAGTVTGSKHLVQHRGTAVLLDCGLFQGQKALRLRNWAAPTGFDPPDLDAVVISHAHIDHIGYLSRIVRRGFRGPVFCTAATADLLKISLPDSAYLQEEEAAHANRHRYSKHHPALPLYTMEDAAAALDLLRPCGYDVSIPVGNALGAVFRPAGHILGSASIALRLDGDPTHILAFSGDLGRWGRPILRDPAPIPAADTLLVECTYGNRTHPADPDGRLAQVVREAADRGAVIIVPAFAIGRTQELVWRIRGLEDDGRIPVLPVYVDSPMAIDVTEIYRRHTNEHDVETARLTDAGRDPLHSRQFHLVRTVQDSKALNDLRGPAIIISASGMVTGGRVLHHLARRLPERRNTVLLVGFQAAGTRGRALQDGAERLRMFGREIAVRASVETLDGLSAHADRDELLRWLGGFERPPRATYLVHGEPSAADAFCTTVKASLHWTVRVAEHEQRVELRP